MNDTTPAREEREYPSDLLERLSGVLRNTGAMSTGKRARRVLDAIMDYGEDAAEKVQELAGALGLGEPATDDPTPVTQALPVTCEVVIPLGPISDMVRVLQTIPADAQITLRTNVVNYHGEPGVRILSEVELERTRPRLVAIWEESR